MLAEIWTYNQSFCLFDCDVREHGGNAYTGLIIGGHGTWGLFCEFWVVLVL